MPDVRQPIDELRQRLRELGYLDAGIDRFVLAPVRQGRSIASAAIQASLRIGLLGALALGPATAVGLAARMPGLVRDPRDGVVLAIYFSVVFFVALAAASLVAIGGTSLLVDRFARARAVAARARGLGRAAGLFVGTACLVYLVAWWRATAEGPQAWHQPGWTLVALIGAAGVSVLFGHTVSMAAQGVMAQRLDSSGSLTGRRSVSRLAPIVVWALAFGGAALLLHLTAPEAVQPPASPPRLDVSATGVPVLVLGVDGFDVDFADGLARSGRLPAFSALLDGARAMADADPGADPATVWTTIATGQPVAVHGVQGLEARRVSGLRGEVPAGGGSWWSVLAVATDRLRLTRPAASSGLQRRAKTIWEVAGEQGVRSGVVNWWASWPAPDHGGIVISDRATLRLDRGGAPDAEIAPPAVWEGLQTAWPSIQDEARRRATEAFRDMPEPAGSALRRGVEQDLIQLALAARIADRAGDLLAIYLPGLDIVQYALVSGPTAAGLPASAMEARVAALERYYIVIDSVLGEFLSAHGTRRLRVLLTDPGRSRTRGPSVMALTGDAARPGARTQASLADIAPTLLHVLGLPVSEELEGRVLTDLLAPAFVTAHPVRSTPTYGRRQPPPVRPGAVPLDDAALERLRSLGYIQR